MQNYIEQYRQIVQRQKELAAVGYASKEAPIAVSVEAKKDKKVASIYLFDAVDKWFGVSAQTIQDAMQGAEDADEINVYINSPGGSVFEGYAMINLLKSYKGTVNTYTYGMAASMGAILTQVAAEKGGKRYMSDDSAMMIHGASTITWGNVKNIESTLEMLTIINDQIAAKFTATTGQPADTVKEWLSKDTWFSPQQALDNGLIDSITLAPSASITAMFGGAAPTPPAHTPPAEASTPQHPTDTPTTMKQLLAHFALEATLSEEGIITALQTRMDQLQAAATAATTKAADSLKAFAEANKLVAEAQKPAFEALLKAGDLTAASSLLTIPVIKETAVLQPGANGAASGIPTGTEAEKTKAEKEAARLAEAEAMGYKSLEAVGKLPQPK
jgi:ATP-dependent Clp endopeptidase proteolytic subunit ClpP